MEVWVGINPWGDPYGDDYDDYDSDQICPICDGLKEEEAEVCKLCRMQGY